MSLAAATGANRDILSDINKTASSATDANGRDGVASASPDGTVTNPDPAVPLAPQTTDVAAAAPAAAASIVRRCIIDRINEYSLRIRRRFSAPNVKPNVIAFDTKEKPQVPTHETTDSL